MIVILLSAKLCVASLSGKKSSPFFQTLETFPVVFPNLGKILPLRREALCRNAVAGKTG